MDLSHCPIQQKLYEYWTDKRGARFAPSRADIHPEEMTSILSHILLIDVVGSPPRFRYRLVGTAFIEAYGREITGRFVDEIDLDDQRDFILADYLGVVRTKEPSLSHWRYTKRDGRFVRYSRLLLPLSRDDSEIDMLLGAVTAQGFG
jgi:hypothetical protein